MCVAFLCFQAQSELLLLIAFNRDENIERSTTPLHIWGDDPNILGGRDLVNGGTWLGLHRRGRFAFVTNFREAAFDRVQGALSRGALPTNFLRGEASPAEYAAVLDLTKYNGFNLVVGDIRTQSVAYVSNRGGEQSLQQLQPGFHGISNGQLGSQWPKVSSGVSAVKRLLEGQDAAEGSLPWGRIFALLNDDRRPPDAQMPRTDMDLETDVRGSSIFVPPYHRPDGHLYGTRSQTVLHGHSRWFQVIMHRFDLDEMAVWASGKVEARERSLDAAGADWHEVAVNSTLLDRVGSGECAA